MPSALVRITPDTAPNCSQRVSSSGVRRWSPRVKNPPMSDPQSEMPDRPMVSAWVTEERRPSKPQPVVGSPPHTTWAYGCTPVQPERMKRTSGRR